MSTAGNQQDSSDLAWKQALSIAITQPEQLLEYLNLPSTWLEPAKAASKLFPLKVPLGFANRIEKANPNDPLLKQILPLAAELIQTPGYSADPLQEQASNPIPGLLHKYHGRVLLIATGICAVNCRYCFRREFPYQDNNPGSKGWDKALEYIKSDSSITEVILSGGDPLLLSDKPLQNLLDKMAEICHVKTVRFHTRLPIVLPERITDSFIELLRNSRLNPVIVLHCNHPNEIDAQVSQVLSKLKAAGITLLNQAVLLAGVNDDLEAQVALQQKLFENGVLPYYLHMLDKVQGSAHFFVSEAKAKQLIFEMTQRLPGYLVPKLAREVAGMGSKLHL
ncbi:MAG: Lysine 2,3-aminomutase [Gammaproteobacteria bacterium]|jgi:EF-P beta-lysylation protein EpmB|nr:Lysine 2,3-aminomutase [Gammaproteobacteria bacterium]